MAKSDLPQLSEAQLEIMEVVWEGEEVTVSDVWGVLCQRRSVARNTILTLMERLEKKGWLSRRAEGNTHYYAATASRQSTLSSVVSRLVDTTFAGSIEGLMLALLDGRGLSASEAERLRKMINQARRKKS